MEKEIYNQVIFIGRVSFIKESFTKTQNRILNFSVSRLTTKKEDKEKKYTSLRVSVFNTEELIKDGDEVKVIGFLTTDEWVDKNSGEKKKQIKVIATSLELRKNIKQYENYVDTDKDDYSRPIVTHTKEKENEDKNLPF